VPGRAPAANRFRSGEIPDRLVGRAHFGIQAHEAAVDFLSRLVLLEHRSEVVRRLVVGTAPLERVCQRKLHPDVQFCQEAATLGAPVLITILRQELTAVGGERALEDRDIPPPQPVLGKVLKPVRIDGDVLHVEREHGVFQAQVGGAVPAP
jgi:hypothetical protein